MPGLVPGIHVFDVCKEDVDGRGTRASRPVFDGPCPAMTQMERAMDLRFTPEENAFRDEVRAFFKANLPDHIRKKAAEGIRYIKDDIVTWQRILNKKG